MLSGLGILIFFAGVIAVPVAILVLIISALSKNVKTRKIGLYVLAGAGIALLASFTLCSVGGRLSM